MQVINSYIYIPVSNLQASASWYNKHLEFKKFKEDKLFLELRSDTGVRIILIDNDDCKVTSHMNYSNGTQAAYGFIVSDINEAYQQLIESGIQVSHITDYVGLSFKLHDPDGNIIELWSDYPKSTGWTIFEPLNKP
ncbi:hypothetical protein Back11_56880 [Paenibacillus baekrokdamisoli]|uniref:Uncharacterized protein n=1 Tax=Paenibacillus baekrokdamisoli TaxID=1712516 RepID=A0A3G9JHA4_9BACL|nr:VOC family protein [Paenibacillus baekrokdamisoli]MBB3073434.1 catechol-2,3-dioxygenase [Paenibacillus baekrokdamisoli]BBH24343.1 hypothetical protein Back11_56880 [Paenibacillus baekrokdamisoli]